jgi:hypothetical protein
MGDAVVKSIRTISRAIEAGKAPNAKWKFKKGVIKLPGTGKGGKGERELVFLEATYKQGETSLWFHKTRPKGSQGVFKPVVEFFTKVGGETVGIIEGGDDHVNPDGADGRISEMRDNSYAGDILFIKGVEMWCMERDDRCVLTAVGAASPSRNPNEGLEFRIKSDGLFEYVGPAKKSKIGKEAATLINGAITTYRSTPRKSYV